jgi:hypothetical protein
MNKDKSYPNEIPDKKIPNEHQPEKAPGQNQDPNRQDPLDPQKDNNIKA